MDMLTTARSTPHGVTVAITDDDAGFSSYVRTFLTQCGYRATAYTRGDELLAGMRHGERPDVVLLDIAMPGMDGLETLKALKVTQPDVEVIMLSGGEQAPTIVEALRRGAADYVVKPHDQAGLGEIAMEAAIRKAVERTALMFEPTCLSGQAGHDTRDAAIHWCQGRAMRHVPALIRKVSDTDATVLVRGESGVGKELVARAVHEQSTRRDKPFVKVNCAALPAELLESELFGHEKGAFTGAVTTRIGKFEQAHFGTIFLDEIGEMSPLLQAKLLHVLQDAEFTKLGSNRKIRVDVRVIAATNRDLEKMVTRGEFREDLYYRLQVIEAYVPPLRERRDEIPFLIDLFIATYAERYNRPPRQLSEDLRRQCLEYDWPGNVRELENMMKRLVVLQDEQFIARELNRPRTSTQPSRVTPPHEVESSLPLHRDADAELGMETKKCNLLEVAQKAALAAQRGVIASTLVQVQWNRRKAAQILGVSYKTLLAKIKETGLEAPTSNVDLRKSTTR